MLLLRYAFHAAHVRAASRLLTLSPRVAQPAAVEQAAAMVVNHGAIRSMRFAGECHLALDSLNVSLVCGF